ncbi:MAG: restriction endonuclease [Alphaproteobacteria bacterium]|nr:restriction endonuclease [Alphaproteobacteria bacterium]
MSGTAKRRFVVGKEGLPDLPGMMLATIEALIGMGGSASIHELDEKIIEIEGLSEAEQSYTMANDDPRSRVKYYLAWARTYLKRGGALRNSSRGVWALTEEGEQLSTLAEMQAIHRQVSDEERERARQKRNRKRANETDSPDDSADVDIEEETPDTDWKSRLLSVLQGIDPGDFERLSQRLLREAGFVKVEVRGKSGDGGIDGVGVLRVNLVSFQIYFQCKRWKGSVGSKEIRDFRGAVQGRADKGLFITTGTFTSQASEEATRDGAIAIDLIDGQSLCELLKQYDLGVRTETVERVTVETDWFEAF